jgi:hypothetical protein
MLTKEKQSEIKFHLGKGSFLPNKCMSNQIVHNSFSKTCCTWGGVRNPLSFQMFSKWWICQLEQSWSRPYAKCGYTNGALYIWVHIVGSKQSKGWKITKVDGLVSKCERVEKVGGKSPYGLKQDIP